MDDDGDYFTWTLDETKSVLNEKEAQAACLYYDINEIGEMHHNPAKNVLYLRAPLGEIAQRMTISRDEAGALIQAAKTKMYAARLKRPTPYVDKSLYTGWNALCISAYLEAAKVLALDDARHFALRSLDRILAEGWDPNRGLSHVIAYSDPNPAGRKNPGLLDDYAFTALACLDAYEATSDLNYFRFAQRIADRMIERFFDPAGGGFFDTETSDDGKKALGVLGARRKPFQDSPTPAGNPMAVIALMRLRGYTGKAEYRDRAEQTLEVLADSAGQYGIFAGTYGMAAVYFSQPHQQVVIAGSDALANELYAAAVREYVPLRAVLKLAHSALVAENLPPALAETIPNLPAIQKGQTVALVCSGFSCQPPVNTQDELAQALRLTTSDSKK